MISPTVILLSLKLLSKTKLKDKIVDKLVRQTKKPKIQQDKNYAFAREIKLNVRSYEKQWFCDSYRLENHEPRKIFFLKFHQGQG